MHELQPATTMHAQMRLVAYRVGVYGNVKGVYEIPADYPLPWGMVEMPEFAERLAHQLLGDYVLVR